MSLSHPDCRCGSGRCGSGRCGSVYRAHGRRARNDGGAPGLIGSPCVTQDSIMTPSRDIGRLLDIMAALRTPGTGCPWDLAQDFSTIAPYTLEEAYEVADAIARGDLTDLKEELGDLLLQVVFHARMAEEQRSFDFGDVVDAITQKLIRRHPHVFGDEHSQTPEAVKGLWERIKAQEKQEKRDKAERNGGTNEVEGALAGVPVALPALTRALKLQAK